MSPSADAAAARARPTDKKFTSLFRSRSGRAQIDSAAQDPSRGQPPVQTNRATDLQPKIDTSITASAKTGVSGAVVQSQFRLPASQSDRKTSNRHQLHSYTRRSSNNSFLAVPNFSRPPLRSVGIAVNNGSLANMRVASSPSFNRQPGTLKTSRPSLKRWDGVNRLVHEWDGLRKDKELWDPEGDCIVHFYSHGNSRRGPSLRVSSRALHEASCGPLFEYFATEMPRDPRQSSSHCPVDRTIPHIRYEFYIANSGDSGKDGAGLWHATTRNFFAFVLRKPLVGIKLGEALIDLRKRMEIFRADVVDNDEDFLQYATQMGYLDFAHSPDNALAMLNYAEHYQIFSLWIEAFAHVVGMNGNLHGSAEFSGVSTVTEALIMRAALDMDLRITRASKSLRNFLEDELSDSHMGISEPARVHLDRFRSFLHAFYVEKVGYWPPPEKYGYPKTLYKVMYADFHNLYSYMVDKLSTDSMHTPTLPSGGICVMQHVQSFNNRYRLTPLPHALPLLPTYPSEHSGQSRRRFPTLTVAPKKAKHEKYLLECTSLFAATNKLDEAATKSGLVSAYRRFEMSLAAKQEEKISASEARKVRWMLVYGTLQMLVSAVRAPVQVQDVDRPVYPLACNVPATPPWVTGLKTLVAPTVSSVDAEEKPVQKKKANPELLRRSVLIRESEEVPRSLTPLSLHPDNEEEDGETYTNSCSTASERSAPLYRSTSSKTVATLTSMSGFNSLRNSVVSLRKSTRSTDDEENDRRRSRPVSIVSSGPSSNRQSSLPRTPSARRAKLDIPPASVLERMSMCSAVSTPGASDTTDLTAIWSDDGNVSNGSDSSVYGESRQSVAHSNTSTPPKSTTNSLPMRPNVTVQEYCDIVQTCVPTEKTTTSQEAAPPVPPLSPKRLSFHQADQNKEVYLQARPARSSTSVASTEPKPLAPSASSSTSNLTSRPSLPTNKSAPANSIPLTSGPCAEPPLSRRRARHVPLTLDPRAGFLPTSEPSQPNDDLLPGSPATCISYSNSLAPTPTTPTFELLRDFLPEKHLQPHVQHLTESLCRPIAPLRPKKNGMPPPGSSLPKRPTTVQARV